MIKKLLTAFLVFGFLAWPAGVSAQAPDYQCIGKALATYMNAVLAASTQYPSINILSPAFNMTSFTFEGIVTAMAANGARFGDLDGIAGNVYNVDGRVMTSWLTEKLAMLPAAAQSKPVYLTEIGMIEVAPPNNVPRDVGMQRLKDEIAKMKPAGNQWRVKGMTLFDSFATNPDGAFAYNFMNDSEIAFVCGGACGPVGINYALPYYQGPEQYSRAQGLQMGFALEIGDAGNKNGIFEGIRRAQSAGMSAIIRLGVGDNAMGWLSPSALIALLTQIQNDAGLGIDPGRVYVLAGPNEPETEQWLTKTCGGEEAITAKGSPLQAGFKPLKYGCNATTSPEFHPLRPYPGSPWCDPLIPRSVPQAPDTGELKFNTFSCGTSLTPQIEQVFDPYGDNTRYEGGIVYVGDYQYASTWCNTRTGETCATSGYECTPYIPKFSGGDITCWRTSNIDMSFNLSKSNVGILGNTQDPLDDATKMNNYIVSYLYGRSIGETSKLSGPSDRQMTKYLQYSGPVRKLTPLITQKGVIDTVRGTTGSEVHNYEQYRKNVPFQMLPMSSLEDAVGEFSPYVTYQNQPPSVVGPVYNPVVKLDTAKLQLVITKAELAQ